VTTPAKERSIIRRLKRQLAKHPKSRVLRVALARHRAHLRALMHPVRRTSAAGVAFIRREEGCILHPYNDSQGYATIGVGHLLHYSRVSNTDVARWRGFSHADADALLRADLGRFETVVRDAFRGARLKPNRQMFDACVSLAFNIGTAGFARSTVAREIKAGNKRAAAAAFLNWSHPSELRDRRRRERSLFLS
jgi:GH24 family phage-related lysozyme (muramidase)